MWGLGAEAAVRVHNEGSHPRDWGGITLCHTPKSSRPAPFGNDIPPSLPPKLAALIWIRSTMIMDEENHSRAPEEGKNGKE